MEGAGEVEVVEGAGEVAVVEVEEGGENCKKKKMNSMPSKHKPSSLSKLSLARSLSARLFLLSASFCFSISPSVS